MRDVYLIGQRVRGRVAYWASVCDTADLRSHLQHMSQRQVANVNILWAVGANRR